MRTGSEELRPCPPGHLPAGFGQATGRVQRAFLELLERSLAGVLETPVAAEAKAAEPATMGGFVARQENAGCLVALELSPLDGCAVLSLSREVVFRLLDIFTATPSNAVPAPREGLTGIELHILQDVFEVFRRSFSAAWEPLYPLSFRIVAVGVEKTRKAAAGQSGQATLVMRSRLQLAEAGGDFEIAVPGFLLRLAEAMAKRNMETDVAVERVQDNLLAALGRAVLQVDAVLSGPGVRMGDLLSMKRGQIFSLGKPAGSTFECLVNGKAQFEGEMIASGGRQAFRIESQSGATPELAK